MNSRKRNGLGQYSKNENNEEVGFRDVIDTSFALFRTVKYLIIMAMYLGIAFALFKYLDIKSIATDYLESKFCSCRTNSNGAGETLKKSSI